MLDIYIEDLTAKLKGYSVGRWITLPMDEEELRKEINEMLLKGQRLDKYNDLHEEWEIEDYEWDEDICEIFSVDKNDNIFQVNSDLLIIEESAQRYEYKIIKFLLDDLYVYSVNEAVEKLTDTHIYENSTLEEVAQYNFEEFYNFKKDEIFTRYIDFKSWGEDLRHDGYFQVGKDVIHYY